MLTTYNDIKAELLSEWEHLNEDRLHEYADSNTPVYYSDIMEEWRQLPDEAMDAWQEFGAEYTPESTIFSFMTTDLHLYYLGLVEQAYAEIKTEKESELENA